MRPMLDLERWAAWLRLSLDADGSLDGMVGACAKYLNERRGGGKPCWLTLLGKKGTGKTHCATRVFQHIAGQSDWMAFAYLPSPVYWPKLVEELRARDDDAGMRYLELMSQPVVLLDDIGAERDTTGFAMEKLNTLLGARTGRWTIITSNLLLAHLSKSEPRIGDRIVREPGNQWAEVLAESWALRKASQ